jgi:hypothetical protein
VSSEPRALELLEKGVRVRRRSAILTKEIFLPAPTCGFSGAEFEMRCFPFATGTGMVLVRVMRIGSG